MDVNHFSSVTAFPSIIPGLQRRDATELLNDATAFSLQCILNGHGECCVLWASLWNIIPWWFFWPHTIYLF